MSESDEVVAAGGVVLDNKGAQRTLLVHRPKYDDWSFPKGKLDPGESVKQAALREVEEETGFRCRIIRKLSTLRYSYRNRGDALRMKVVHYFLMEAVEGSLSANIHEIDAVEWLESSEARLRLTYDRDKELLDLALQEENQRNNQEGE